MKDNRFAEYAESHKKYKEKLKKECEAFEEIKKKIPSVEITAPVGSEKYYEQVRERRKVKALQWAELRKALNIKKVEPSQFDEYTASKIGFAFKREELARQKYLEDWI